LKISLLESGVILRNPVFDLPIELGSLHDDLFCFSLRGDVRKGVVNRVSLSPTGLEIVGVLVRGFAQQEFRAFQGHPVMSDLLMIRYPAQAIAIFAAWSAAL
jgi:hypothetical protein